MRILDAVYNALDSFANMNEIDRVELRRSAMEWYGATQKKLDSDEPMPMKELLKKVFPILESWWFRTAVAVLYVYFVPKITAYWRGDSEGKNEDDERYNELMDELEEMRRKRK